MGKISIFTAGLILGLLGCYGYFNYNLNEFSFDMNRDGVPDVQYLFRKNTTVKQMSIDRNHDGKDDTVIKYNRYGIPINEHSDDNFDGVYDTDIKYQSGILHKIKIDTNQDGEYEVILLYRFGVLEAISYLDDNGNEESRNNLLNLKVNVLE